MNLPNKIKKLLLAGTIALATIGCAERSKTNKFTPIQPTNSTPTAQPQPLYAQFTTANEDGSIVAATDLRNSTFGDVISINTANGQDQFLFTPQAISFSYSGSNGGGGYTVNSKLEGLFGDIAVIKTPTTSAIPNNFQMDLIFKNAKTGATLFATASNDKQEDFIGKAGGQLLFIESGIQNWTPQIKKVDPSTGNVEPAIPGALFTYLIRGTKDAFLITERSYARDKLHAIDKTTGVATMLFDLNTLAQGGYFNWESTEKLAVINDFNGGLIFQPMGTTLAAVTLPQAANNISRDIMRVAQNGLSAIMREYDNNTNTEEFFHLDLTASTPTAKIPLPAGTQIYWALVGDKTVLLPDWQNNKLFAYSRQNGLWEPVAQQMPGLPVLNTQIITEYDGKAAVLAEVFTGSNDEKVFWFDGTDLINAFPNVQNAQGYRTFNSQNGKVISRLGKTYNTGTASFDQSILTLNVQTGQAHTIPVTSTARIEDIAVSGTDVAYVLTNPALSQNNELNIASIAQSATPTPVVVSQGRAPKRLYGFTQNGNAVYVSENSGPKELTEYKKNAQGLWTPKTLANE